ncbi:MAG: exodeoxyribonuclease III [Myxococcales bacterium]
MKIVTYNINGVVNRLPLLLSWLERTAPDVVCLQELKTDAKRFPSAALREAGYGAAWVAEGSYNGVAVLTRDGEPLITRRELPGDSSDKQPRYIEAAVAGVLIGCLYAPNGNPQPGPRFDYKLAWLQRLHAHAQALLAAKVPVVLAGDYNVVPTERDMYASKSSWRNDALVQPEPRARFRRLLDLGYTDALHSLHPDEPLYTFWDYKRFGWERGHGLRIDHFLLSPALAPRLVSGGVEHAERALEGASDHAPAWIELAAADRVSARLE